MLSLQKPGPSSLRNLCALCVSVLAFFFALQRTQICPRAPRRSRPAPQPIPGRSRPKILRPAPPATLRLMNPPCTQQEPFHIGCTDCPRRELFDFHYTRRRRKFLRIQFRQRKSPCSSPAILLSRIAPRCPSARTRSGLRNPPSTSSSSPRWTCASLQRRAAMSVVMLPKPAPFLQHDDPCRLPLGRRALQQRQLSREKHALRRKLQS